MNSFINNELVYYYVFNIYTHTHGVFSIRFLKYAPYSTLSIPHRPKILP